MPIWRSQGAVEAGAFGDQLVDLPGACAGAAGEGFGGGVCLHREYTPN